MNLDRSKDIERMSNREIIKELRDIKYYINDLSTTLAYRVLQTTLKQAIEEGLVRFNFPTPPGFRRHLMQDK